LQNGEYLSKKNFDVPTRFSVPGSTANSERFELNGPLVHVPGIGAPKGSG
jgi:hypothetical protein